MAGLVRRMAESSERLLVECLPLLEQIVESLCARKGMDADDVEEFAGEVRLRLVSRDYAILKAYAGRSSLKTYLAAVVGKLLLDYRNQRWGKWRDSANAQHLGPVAVELERLLYRSRKTPDEAFTTLLQGYPSLTREEFEALAARIRPRVSRKPVSLDEAALISAPESGVDLETTDTAARISSVVGEYLDKLPDEDQLIFRLRFDSDLTVREIAKSLHLDQQRVFRRLYRHYQLLGGLLKSAGIDAGDVERVIGNDTTLLDFQLKKRAMRPSEEERSAADVREEDISS